MNCWLACLLGLPSFNAQAPREPVLHRASSGRFHALDPEHGTTTATTAKNFGRVPLATFDICKE